MHSNPQRHVRRAAALTLALIATATIVSAPRIRAVPTAFAASAAQPSSLASPGSSTFEVPLVTVSADASRLAVRALIRAAQRGGPHSRQQLATSAPTTVTSGRPDWDATAYCESHDQWNINAGTYWGGLQFAHSTWFAFGGGPFDGTGWFPYSREQQIAVAERVLAVEGPGAWPVCFRWASG
jgi:transglycosylase-like protein